MDIFKKKNPGDIKRIVLKCIWIRRYRVSPFILAVASLIVFSRIPYVNLFFSYYLIIFISVILAPFILDIDDRLIFLTAIILFTLTLIMWFIDRYSAEMIANYIFIILFSAVGKALFASGKI